MATTQQVTGKNNNPTGKGGFGDHPENRNPGGWKPEVTLSYQYKRFLKMTDKQLVAFEKLPSTKKTLAMQIAYAQVKAARKSLIHAKEIADRTEGKAPQAIDFTSKGDKIVPIMGGSSVHGHDGVPEDSES